MKIEKIDWVDSSSQTGWRSKEELKKPCSLECSSIGFVSYEDKDTVVVSGSKALISSRENTDDPYDFNGNIRIPKVAITKRKRIKV